MRRLGVAILAAIIMSLTIALSAGADAGIDGRTNAFRQANGLAPLATSATLTTIAQRRASDIVSVFAHPSDWSSIWPAGCSGIGENITWATGILGSDWAVTAWVNSPVHRANMLGRFNVQGSALIHSGGNSYAVQVFGQCGGVALAPAASQPVRKAPVAPTVAPALPDTAMDH